MFHVPRSGKRAIPGLLVALTLSACASLPKDGGRANVNDLLAQHGRQMETPAEDKIDALVGELLAKPLSPENAVRIGFLKNPKLRAAYARLGIAGAEVFEAGRLSNPGISASFGFGNAAAGADKTALGIVQNFTNLLMLPSRSRLAKGEFEREQQEVAQEILDFGTNIETEYFTLLGAEQTLAMHKTMRDAGESSAELASRFRDAGNISLLELSLEQAAAAESRLGVLNSEASAQRSRHTLSRLMGLSSGAKWSLPDTLPEPLKESYAPDKLADLAAANRLDLAAARRKVELLADSLNVTKNFRWLGNVEVGVEQEREGASRLTGPTLALELPLFNQGQGAVSRADYLLKHAVAEVEGLETEIRSAVHIRHSEFQAAQQRALEYRDRLIPLREQVVAETQKQVNFMLSGVFELLQMKQQEYAAYLGYVEAIRDYWVARAELKREVGVPLPCDLANASKTDGAQPKSQSPESDHCHFGENP